MVAHILCFYLAARLSVAAETVVCFPTVPFFVYLLVGLGPKF